MDISLENNASPKQRIVVVGFDERYTCIAFVKISLKQQQDKLVSSESMVLR